MNADILKDVLKNQIKPKTLLVDNIYVSRSLIRVRIVRNASDENRSLCFCIDYGYEEWIAMDDIFVCKPEFIKLPAQAFCMSMFGLEDFADFADATNHLDTLLVGARALVAEVLSDQNVYVETERVSVGLYDMHAADDVILNDVIRTKICESFEPPALQVDSLTNVVILHVDDEGAVFCQPRTSFDGLQYVMKLINLITTFEFNRDAHRISCVEDLIGNSKHKPVYLVQDTENSKWYRATVLQRDGSVYRMFYVDFGMTRLVNAANIFRLNSLSSALNFYPYQAIKCHLQGLCDLQMVANLRGYLNANKPAIVSIFNSQMFVSFVKIDFISVESHFHVFNSSSCANIHSRERRTAF